MLGAQVLPGSGGKPECINGVAAFRTASGSVTSARIENQAAVTLPCHSWLDDEETLERIRNPALAQLEARQTCRSQCIW